MEKVVLNYQSPEPESEQKPHPAWAVVITAILITPLLLLGLFLLLLCLAYFFEN